MRAELHDGRVLEFPDGTDPAVIQATVKRVLGQGAATQAGRNAPGWQQGLASVMQGPAFGFADEIGGAVGGAYKALKDGKPLGEGYRETRDFLRGAADQQAEENPWMTGITRAMASAPTMLFGGGGAGGQAASLIQRSAQAGKTGLLTGAAGGVGSSSADTVGGLLKDGAAGASVGGLLGGAVQPVAAGMGSMGGNIASRFNESVAGRYAKEKVAEAFARDARGTVAQQNPAAPFTQAATRMDKLGPEGRVVDAGGQNARQLLDTLAMLPGRTKEATEAAIRSRQASRGGRLTGSAGANLGVGNSRLGPNLEAWAAQREAQAAPLYAQLHQTRVQPDGDLIAMVAAAENLGAAKVAERIAEARMQPYTPGAPSGGGWAMRDLDNLKQGLDSLIATKVDKMDGGYTPEGAALIQLKNRLTAKLDELTGGAYADARAAYAGPSALMDAARSGRAALTRDDFAIQQAMSGLGASELQAFKMGAYEALRAKMGKEGGQTEILKMWKEPATQERLRAVFGDERSFRNFAADVAKEARMKALDGVGRGSQTAARTYGAGDLDFSAVADVTQALAGTGGVTGMISNLSRAWNRVQTPEPVRGKRGLKAALTQSG